MTTANYSAVNGLPFHRHPTSSIAEPSTWLTELRVAAYVPTVLERNGNFSQFTGQLLDPLTGTPFPGNIIPMSRLGGVMAWRVSSALPPGLSLRTDTTGGGSAGIIGVATAPGSYTFTATAASAGQTTSQTFTMRITGLNLAEATIFRMPTMGLLITTR